MGGSLSRNLGLPPALSHALNAFSYAAAPFTAGATLALPLSEAAGRTSASISNAPKDAAAALSLKSGQDIGAQSTLNTQLLSQPKTITPDNYLASQNVALQNLRLGLASTMTMAGGAPSPVLSRPSLVSGGPGKTKLGQ